MDQLAVSNEVGDLVHDMIVFELPNIIIWLALRLYPSQALKRDTVDRRPILWNPPSELDYHLFREVGCHFIMLPIVVVRPATLVLCRSSLQTAISHSPMIIMDAYLKWFLALPAKPLHITMTKEVNLSLCFSISLMEAPEKKFRAVKSFVAAAPKSLSTRDMVSHMYPFMTAAANAPLIAVSCTVFSTRIPPL